MNTQIQKMQSSNSDEWETPEEFFKDLDREFHFTLDPCASEVNHKCDKYYTRQDDGLSKSWEGETVFCNPPYSEVKKWVEKCYREGIKDRTTVVLTIPARTDTGYFHDFIYHRAEIRLVRGRLHFSKMKVNAPFPSIIVIFRGAYA